MDRKIPLVVNCYPRSGSHFVLKTIELSFDNIEQKGNCHNANQTSIYHLNGIFILSLVRHPLYSISSWFTFRNTDFKKINYGLEHGIEKDIAFYIRMNSFIKESIHKIPVILFEDFVDNPDYIRNTVTEKFGYTPTTFPSVADIKSALVAEEKEQFLPRNNSADMELVQNQLLSQKEYSQALNLYQSIVDMLH